MNTIMFIAGIFIGFTLIAKGAKFLVKFADTTSIRSLLVASILLWFGNFSLSAFADFGLLAILVTLLVIRLKHPGLLTKVTSLLTFETFKSKLSRKKKEKVGESK